MCGFGRRIAGHERDGRRRSVFRRHWCVLQSVVLLLLCAISGIGVLHAHEPTAQPKALLDQIWPYQPSPKRPLSKQDQEYAEAALVQWLEAYLRREYEVVDRRFFWGERNSSGWVAISKGHASLIGAENSRWHGVDIEQAWHDPGFDLARLWKINIDGVDRYFVVAMTDQPVPGTRGRRLIGRFELKKVVD